MHKDRFNHLMMLHIHKDTVDKLPLGECVNGFISFNAHRSNSIANFDLLHYIYYKRVYLTV